jgi:hypothetical protein
MTVESMSRPGRAELDAARLLLERLGVSAADLLRENEVRPPAPTFAEYVPLVSDAVSDGNRRVYGSYWNRLVEHWGSRRLDEPRPSEIEQLAAHWLIRAADRSPRWLRARWSRRRHIRRPAPPGA